MIKYNVKAGLKMDEYNTSVPTAYMYMILQSLQCFYKTYNVHSELSKVPGTDPIAKMFQYLHVTNSELCQSLLSWKILKNCIVPRFKAQIEIKFLSLMQAYNYLH